MRSARTPGAVGVPQHATSAWGRNDIGQLGDDPVINRTTPVPIGVLQGATDIASGVDYTVAARDDGSVIAWGANANANVQLRLVP
ncbi:hypothetical protein [Streptomyces sp. Ncost-T10-10d]|uniref:hypothetical protein n=1 Tax=Streptomyces sp. Ncost-T10-10d TaxID=1839774 RepID=UPI00081D9DC8|nr:hypothetical protein [Streptomyces sp. Ncost-T10-10d]SCF91368.1 Regulator of chromosome condensation (RCC1) repeat-containing protein [Streptomyces sp. Ncost-T10-10d]